MRSWSRGMLRSTQATSWKSVGQGLEAADLGAAAAGADDGDVDGVCHTWLSLLGWWVGLGGGILAGWVGWRFLGRDPHGVAGSCDHDRKPPHRFPTKTPESASPLGERKIGDGCRECMGAVAVWDVRCAEDGRV